VKSSTVKPSNTKQPAIQTQPKEPHKPTEQTVKQAAVKENVDPTEYVENARKSYLNALREMDDSQSKLQSPPPSVKQIATSLKTLSEHNPYLSLQQQLQAYITDTIQ
jgi:hypothetical protein